MIFLCYPKCTTCQKARTWLESNSVAYEERHIKDDHPTEEELRRWHERSGLPLRRFFNTSGLLYRKHQLKDKLPNMTEDEMYALLAKMECCGARYLSLMTSCSSASKRRIGRGR